jgi:LysR family nitrogen assimilation transcriptional regulator
MATSDGFELELLRSLLDVMETESITIAARRLGLTQSTVSKHITTLESRFGVRLFYRDGRGVKATQAGYLLADRSRRILDRLSAIGPQYSSVVESPIIRILMPPSVTALSLSSFFSIILDYAPDVAVRMVESPVGDVIEALRHGEIDIALLYAVPDLRGLTTVSTIVYPLHLVIPVKGPIAQMKFDASAINRVAFALPARPDGLRLQVDDFASTFGHKIHVKFEVSSTAMIKDLVRNGLAASYLPWNAIAEDVLAGRIQIVPTLPLSPSLSIVIPTGRLQSALINRISEDFAVVLERQVALAAHDFQTNFSNISQPFSFANKLPGSIDT